MTMSVAAHMREAGLSLRSAKQRTLLALTGIVIGVGAVIALLTTGSIARSEALRQFQTLGTDMVSVIDISPRGNNEMRRVLKISDADALTGLPSVLAAAPYNLDSVIVALPGQGSVNMLRVGVTADFADMHDIVTAEGRFISSFDGPNLSAFAVLGAGVAGRLRDGGLKVEVGSYLRVQQDAYLVVGLLAPSSGKGPSGVLVDDSMLLPIELAVRERADEEMQSITLRIGKDVHYLDATKEIQGHFALVAPQMNIRVDSPVPLIEQMEGQMRLFTLLLGAVGGIALVLGGVGVMNAMLSSVGERRLEIGIRRALGAKRGDVRLQFLVESVLLCLMGGVLGAGLGVGASLLICMYSGWSWQWSFTALALGLGTSCAAGIFFGYHPARQAARLDPVVAMRES
ncbi:MAG: ABC transporter permease [Gammaproteobacteria bacterium]|nr:ABC transporter permease [Gammaproteobacteria bacterium]MCY4199663.1 ABC transporter permease [Gammaproteobacteria bacterium]MCY4277368.1 ABC transporter permease [Gammaproteobacteria bacterium]